MKAFLFICIIVQAHALCQRRCRTHNPATCAQGYECLVSNTTGKPECFAKGEWASWSGWSPCVTPCENGTRTRTRECGNLPDTNCPGISSETDLCDAPYCYFSYCDFTTSFCTWMQSNSDTLDWTRNSGQTSSLSTGPNSDVSGTGYYIYTEASTPNENRYADLVSAIYAKGRPYCFQMYTNMYGADMGSISVIVQDVITNSKETIASYNQADTSPIWRKRNINIPARANAFKIILRGNTGSSYTSDAAVDNIRVTDGPC